MLLTSAGRNRKFRIEILVTKNNCEQMSIEDDYPRPLCHNIANENKQTDFLLTILFFFAYTALMRVSFTHSTTTQQNMYT